MVDVVVVERRMTNLPPSHTFALRRLSSRATTTNSSSSSSRSALLPLSTLADTLLSLLRPSIPISPGLTDSEFARLEAEFSFTFPPDLKALLAAGVPIGPGFPDWRCPSSIGILLRLPIAAVSIQIVKNNLWSNKSWGPRPADPGQAVRVARERMKRAPVMVPVFERRYVPCSPSFAGNPVFYVDENRVVCCGSDLSDFFERELLGSSFRVGLDTDCVAMERSDAAVVVGKLSMSSSSSDRWRRSIDTVLSGGGGGGARSRSTPRWIGFWSEVAADDHRRRKRISNSSSSSSCCSTSTISCYSSSSAASSPDRVLSGPGPARHKSPKWVDDYMNRIGSMLREGGWYETDVSEIVDVSPASSDVENETFLMLLDNQAVLDSLLLKADRFSDSLRRAGWSSEEVNDVFGFDFRVPEKKGRRRLAAAKELSPEVMERIEELVRSVCRSKEKMVVGS